MPYTFGNITVGLIIPSEISENPNFSKILNVLMTDDEIDENEGKMQCTWNYNEQIWYIGELLSKKKVTAISSTDCQELIDMINSVSVSDYESEINKVVKEFIGILETLSISEYSTLAGDLLHFLENQVVRKHIVWATS